MEERYINPDSDGKFYGLQEMARTNCGDCKGCHACCMGMGDSIRLDPYDLLQLREGLGAGFEQLLAEGRIAMTAEDGLLVPYLCMMKEGGACGFLNEEGRCSIHSFRPGICRLFPMGRDYSQGTISYICLTKLCPAPKSKIKVERWIGIEDSLRYQSFVLAWHDLKRNLQRELVHAGAEEAKQLNLYVISRFYACEDWKRETFFDCFFQKVQTVYHAFGIDT